MVRRESALGSKLDARRQMTAPGGYRSRIGQGRLHWFGRSALLRVTAFSARSMALDGVSWVRWLKPHWPFVVWLCDRIGAILRFPPLGHAPPGSSSRSPISGSDGATPARTRRHASSTCVVRDDQCPAYRLPPHALRLNVKKANASSPPDFRRPRKSAFPLKMKFHSIYRINVLRRDPRWPPSQVGPTHRGR